MNLLALDTSSVACSVALQCGEELVERHEERPREHTRLLMPMITAVLQESELELRQLDAIVLGNGPGSFIGMRIAASVAQGLAFAAGLNIVPVSSMAAVAAEVFACSDAREVVVAQDAHMTEVYLGYYARDADGMPQEITAEKLHSIETIDELDPEGRAERLLAGYGWQRYPDLVTLNKGRYARLAAVSHPRAKYLTRIAVGFLGNGLDIPPQNLVPAYLRQKVAQKSASAS